MRIKSYLQLSRFHSSVLEIIPAIVGASLATGNLFDINVLLWAIYANLYHVTGYSMNSYTDWKSGYDKDDPNKQHFPLNKGTLSPNKAKWAVYILAGITFIYGVILLIGNWIAFIVIFTGAIAGAGYNIIGKEIGWKSLLIAYAHSTVFAVPYLASGGRNANLLLVGWGYVFLWVLYQINIEGDIKDMDTDEENFLINYGAYYEDFILTDNGGYVHFPSGIVIYSHVLKLFTAIFGVLIAFELGATLYIMGAVLFIIGVASLVFGSDLLQSGEYNRQDRISTMATIELLTLYGLIVAATPVIGTIEGFILFIGSIVWVLVFNKIEWGSLLAPNV